MSIKESIQQIETLIEAWQLDEADLNQTDINAMQVLLKENKDLKKQLEIGEPLHIGKSSAGWKFLFQEVNKYNSFDWELEIHTFEQWKEFLENNNEIVILNEYDEEVSVKDFLDLVEKKQKQKCDEYEEYSKNVNGYRFTDRDFR